MAKAMAKIKIPTTLTHYAHQQVLAGIPSINRQKQKAWLVKKGLIEVANKLKLGYSVIAPNEMQHGSELDRIFSFEIRTKEQLPQELNKLFRKVLADNFILMRSGGNNDRREWMLNGKVCFADSTGQLKFDITKGRYVDDGFALRTQWWAYYNKGEFKEAAEKYFKFKQHPIVR